jgi:hypothetical protein
MITKSIQTPATPLYVSSATDTSLEPYQAQVASTKSSQK